MTSNRSRALVITGGVVVLLLTAGGIGAALWSESANETTRTCAVTDKDRTTVSTRDSTRSDMRIYTEDCGTLAVNDLITRGQFNSADIYASIEPGNTYEITTVGWRTPWLSMFPVVLGVPDEVTR